MGVLSPHFKTCRVKSARNGLSAAEKGECDCLGERSGCGGEEEVGDACSTFLGGRIGGIAGSV